MIVFSPLAILVTKAVAAELIWCICVKFAMKKEENARWMQLWPGLLGGLDEAWCSADHIAPPHLLFPPPHQRLLLWSFEGQFVCLWGHFIHTPPVISYLFQEISKYFVLLSGQEWRLLFVWNGQWRGGRGRIKKGGWRASTKVSFPGNYGDEGITVFASWRVFLFDRRWLQA